MVAALFRLENNCDEQGMLIVLGKQVDWLKAPEQMGLRRAFVVWIRRVLLPYQKTGSLSAGIQRGGPLKGTICSEFHTRKCSFGDSLSVDSARV
ncbi:hypothetical protein SAMN05421693_1504 [Ectothiorhodospira magna]|uniref:Uncharacterized protein n=1 Tax=Ectothiorhodospira magna TaxID=867345 RepID=A0A1H9GTP1_9GAMM|nr:hypothetical protein [Ectothiorhodospira magna]SEQ53435.1 hypothetical protein SAMN05421693_1504 [Ectothiorhodospira magna]